MPRRPVVGRSGDDALPLLLTLSSGAKRFTTIHAGRRAKPSLASAFIRQLADTSLPLSALTDLVSEALGQTALASKVAQHSEAMDSLAPNDSC